MYSYIKGELAEIGTESITVEASGIGYCIYISSMAFSYLPSIGEDVIIFTYLYVREDAMIFYGFLDKDDLYVFKQLITVSGIGPKGALGILSVLSADDLRFAILSGDAKTISKAPGIGAKTAQRVILDLKDKMSLEEAFEKKIEHNELLANRTLDNQVKNEAVMALTSLGYSSAESLKAVSSINISSEMGVEDVLKSALKNMSNF